MEWIASSSGGRLAPSAALIDKETCMAYVTGFLTPVPIANKAAYIASAKQGWEMFKRYGALSMKKKDDEVVVFSWLMWPDKKAADDAWAKMMEDPAMKDMQMPFDGQRMM